MKPPLPMPSTACAGSSCTSACALLGSRARSRRLVPGHPAPLAEAPPRGRAPGPGRKEHKAPSNASSTMDQATRAPGLEDAPRPPLHGQGEAQGHARPRGPGTLRSDHRAHPPKGRGPWPRHALRLLPRTRRGEAPPGPRPPQAFRDHPLPKRLRRQPLSMIPDEFLARQRRTEVRAVLHHQRHHLLPNSRHDGVVRSPAMVPAPGMKDAGHLVLR